MYKVTWLPVCCTWASGPDCRGSTRLAVSNLGYFSFISGTACPPFSKNGFSAAWLLLMTFALDHAPSKYVQIEQKYGKVRIHLRCFLTCSTPEVTLLCTTVFLRGYWRLDTRVIMYSCRTPTSGDIVRFRRGVQPSSANVIQQQSRDEKPCSCKTADANGECFQI